MIRTVRVPTRVSRMGLVSMGQGGSASSYTFDADGLSDDPQLAPYLQSLTPAQLQAALDGADPSADLANLLTQDLTATGAGALPCGQPGNPCGPLSSSIIPTWAWYVGAGVGGLLVLGAVRK